MTRASRRPRRLEQVLAVIRRSTRWPCPASGRTPRPPKCKTPSSSTPRRGTLLIVGPCKLPELAADRRQLKQFSHYYPGFGECILAEAPVDQWDPDAWREVTRRWERGAKAWLQQLLPLPRRTASSRSSPTSASPSAACFIFMILFVVLIGPINFYWLTQTRRRIWLLWTVPVFSLITCAILFGYMLVSEGWPATTEAASVTVLDEAACARPSAGSATTPRPRPAAACTSATTPSSRPIFSRIATWGTANEAARRSTGPTTASTSTLAGSTPRCRSISWPTRGERRQRIIARPQADGGILIVNALEAR